MRWYLSGPMTGMPDLNFQAFHAEAARLRALGYEVVNPAEINVDPAAGWAECLKRDIAELITCDGVALMAGWEKSRGATLETHIALALGMLVVHTHILDTPLQLVSLPVVDAVGHHHV